MAWKSAAMEMVSCTVMGISQMRNSTVLKNGCTRKIPPDFFCVVNTIGFYQQLYIIFVGFDTFKIFGYPGPWEICQILWFEMICNLSFFLPKKENWC